MQPKTSCVLCALTLLTSFLAVCLGAFFISSGPLAGCCWRNLVATYLLLPLGFLALLCGICWSTYSQLSKSKRMVHHLLHQHRAQGVLATVDRPDGCPPAYEESLALGPPTWSSGRAAPEAPPPAYTEMDLGHSIDIEAPPPYKESPTDAAAAAAPRNTEGQTWGC
ncbi:transmembrane protein 252 [Echinops telfairi]|uniref:Transmembrane protein 252 n=1 Tax=Echinops telfairi TaxID=9371 RepID=A0ABM0J4D9_ECHTE|nr:transmembrane protein 252 [Echinops telfairi]